MKMNRKMHSLATNHSIGSQPALAQLNRLSGQGARHPPRNSVVATAETVIMLMYSARKNIANFSEEYSVWKPPTSSLSASGRSNGARLVSPTQEMPEITHESWTAMINHRLRWASTIWLVDSEPA